MPNEKRPPVGPDSHTLPGYTISPGTIGQYEAFSSFLSSRHLGRAADAADDKLDLASREPDLRRRASLNAQAVAIRASADAAVAAEFFGTGTPAFTASIGNRSLLPRLLYINLRAADPTVTPELAERLVTPENEHRVWYGLVRAWRMLPADAKEPEPADDPKADAPATPADGSTGAAFDGSSAGTEI